MSDDENEPKNNESGEEASLFSDLYKYSSRTMAFSQEKRRELFLQKQKERRCEAFDEKRDLNELFTVESMDYESAKTSKAPKKYPFNYKLMGSEFLTEVPEDLADNWLVKLCPNGVRFLVVANRGVTTCYYKNGRPRFWFKSNLPGGDSKNYDSHRFTVLDCVFLKDLKVFLVYDVLAWNSVSLINAEASMRFYWLQSKFEENPEISNTRKFSFVLMEFFPARNDLLQDRLFTPFNIKECELPFESVLFYHKEGHYIFGKTPLVGFLKTFMLTEILHIDVPLNHLQNKPEDYASMKEYLKSKKKKRRSDLAMETDPLECAGSDCDDM